MTDPLPDRRLGLCIPTYNRAPMLSAVMRDLLPVCRELNVSIHLSDNASRDGTAELGRRLADQNDLVEYRRHDNEITLPENLMAALEMCPADYAWWTGDDDFIHPDGLRIVADWLRDSDPSALVFQHAEVAEEHEVDLSLPLASQLPLSPTGAPNTLTRYRRADELFGECLYKPPLGTFVARVEGIRSSDYQRFYYSMHPHLGAFYDYLALEHIAGGIDAIVSSEAFSISLTRLGSNKKAWNRFVEHIARDGFPDWFSKLHPVYAPRLDEARRFHQHIFRTILSSAPERERDE